jgi:hypothetical protein
MGRRRSGRGSVAENAFDASDILAHQRNVVQPRTSEAKFMRGRRVAAVALAFATAIGGTYAVKTWLDAADPAPSPPPSPPHLPDSSPVAPSTTAEPEPPEPSIERPEPVRTESPAPVDPAPTAIRLRGAVTLLEHLDVDATLPPPDGSFELTVLTSSATLRQTVPVEHGRFELDVPPAAELEVRTLRFGGRAAWIRGETRRSIPDDRHLDLTAICLASRRLDVVDSKDGNALDDVVVLIARTPDEHPGLFRLHDMLIDHKPSPIELAPYFARSGARSARRTTRSDGSRSGSIRRPGRPGSPSNGAAA